MYSALNLSKYIVKKCINDNCPISNLQLQKILYYIQKDFLKRGGMAFYDDFEAWQFGPVIPNVYYYYCGYGSKPIFISKVSYKINKNDSLYIDEIVEQKRVLKPWDMVEETHKKNGAWDKIYKNGEGNHKIIPKDLIKAVG